MPYRSKKSTLDYGLDGSFLATIQSYREVPTAAAELKMLSTFLAQARSQTEKVWLRSHLDIVAKLHGNIHFAGYEWFKFKVPGGSYGPDWSYLTDTGWVQVEVKGSTRQANYRDARSKIRAAAALNPWFTFYMAFISREHEFGWKIERIEPDASLISTYLNHA